MGIPREVPGLSAQTINLIKHKAWSLIGTIGFTWSDRDDLEQELVLDILRRLPRFDPERAQLMTFVVRVLDNKIASIIEARTCPSTRFPTARILAQRTHAGPGGLHHRARRRDRPGRLPAARRLAKPPAPRAPEPQGRHRARASRSAPGPPGAVRPPAVPERHRDLRRDRCSALPHLRQHRQAAEASSSRPGLGPTSVPPTCRWRQPVESSPTRKRGQL